MLQLCEVLCRQLVEHQLEMLLITHTHPQDHGSINLASNCSVYFTTRSWLTLLSKGAWDTTSAACLAVSGPNCHLISTQSHCHLISTQSHCHLISTQSHCHLISTHPPEAAFESSLVQTLQQLDNVQQSIRVHRLPNPVRRLSMQHKVEFYELQSV
jgi:hypothetical protein